MRYTLLLFVPLYYFFCYKGNIVAMIERTELQSLSLCEGSVAVDKTTKKLISIQVFLGKFNIGEKITAFFSFGFHLRGNG